MAGAGRRLSKSGSKQDRGSREINSQVPLPTKMQKMRQKKKKKRKRKGNSTPPRSESKHVLFPCPGLTWTFV